MAGAQATSRGQAACCWHALQRCSPPQSDALVVGLCPPEGDTVAHVYRRGWISAVKQGERRSDAAAVSGKVGQAVIRSKRASVHCRARRARVPVSILLASLGRGRERARRRNETHEMGVRPGRARERTHRASIVEPRTAPALPPTTHHPAVPLAAASPTRTLGVSSMSSSRVPTRSVSSASASARPAGQPPSGACLEPNGRSMPVPAPRGRSRAERRVSVISNRQIGKQSSRASRAKTATNDDRPDPPSQRAARLSRGHPPLRRASAPSAGDARPASATEAALPSLSPTPRRSADRQPDGSRPPPAHLPPSRWAGARLVAVDAPRSRSPRSRFSSNVEARRRTAGPFRRPSGGDPAGSNGWLLREGGREGEREGGREGRARVRVACVVGSRVSCLSPSGRARAPSDARCPRA